MFSNAKLTKCSKLWIDIYLNTLKIYMADWQETEQKKLSIIIWIKLIFFFWDRVSCILSKSQTCFMGLDDLELPILLYHFPSWIRILMSNFAAVWRGGKDMHSNTWGYSEGAHRKQHILLLAKVRCGICLTGRPFNSCF